MYSKADLHIHTWYSYDAIATIPSVLKQAIQQDLKVIAITDHDAIHGAYKARDYALYNNLPIEVIIGQEISSKGGHVIALFIKDLIPPHLSLLETLKRVKDQGGIAMIPHITFSKYQPGERYYRYRVHYLDLLENPETLELVDIIEAVNFTMFDHSLTPNVIEHSNHFNKALAGNSDAHLAKHVGTAHTLFPGETPSDLLEAIKNKTTEAVQVTKPSFKDVISHNSAILKIPFSFGYYTVKNLLKPVRKISTKKA